MSQDKKKNLSAFFIIHDEKIPGIKNYGTKRKAFGISVSLKQTEDRVDCTINSDLPAAPPCPRFLTAAAATAGSQPGVGGLAPTSALGAAAGCRLPAARLQSPAKYPSWWL